MWSEIEQGDPDAHRYSMLHGTCHLNGPHAAVHGRSAAALAMDLGLKDKIVLVTGSTSNIGYATARQFLREGATVIVNSNQQASVDAAIASLRKGNRSQAAGASPLTSPMPPTWRAWWPRIRAWMCWSTTWAA